MMYMSWLQGLLHAIAPSCCEGVAERHVPWVLNILLFGKLLCLEWRRHVVGSLLQAPLGCIYWLPCNKASLKPAMYLCAMYQHTGSDISTTCPSSKMLTIATWPYSSFSYLHPSPLHLLLQSWARGCCNNGATDM